MAKVFKQTSKHRISQPVANGIDKDNQDEDGGNVQASSLPICGSRQQTGLPVHLCVATVSCKLLEMHPEWSPPLLFIELSSYTGSLTYLGAPGSKL